MAELKITGLKKQYPDGTVAIDNFNLKVKDGECVAVFGLDRSGKSTLLRMVAGLEAPTAGKIVCGGKDVTDASTKDRKMAYVFRDSNIDSRLSVYDNLAYGLKIRKESDEVIDIKVKRIAELLNLTDVLDRKPKQLDGLQKRRILLGRALARDPDVYLLDDPLSGLEGELRVKVLQDLILLQSRLGVTFLYATDSVSEAFSIGQRIVILHEGKIEQIGKIEEIVKEPKTDFVKEILKLS